MLGYAEPNELGNKAKQKHYHGLHWCHVIPIKSHIHGGAEMALKEWLDTSIIFRFTRISWFCFVSAGAVKLMTCATRTSRRPMSVLLILQLTWCRIQEKAAQCAVRSYLLIMIYLTKTGNWTGKQTKRTDWQKVRTNEPCKLMYEWWVNNK